jgi:hypothetical protein
VNVHVADLLFAAALILDCCDEDEINPLSMPGGFARSFLSLGFEDSLLHAVQAPLTMI